MKLSSVRERIRTCDMNRNHSFSLVSALAVVVVFFQFSFGFASGGPFDGHGRLGRVLGVQQRPKSAQKATPKRPKSEHKATAQESQKTKQEKSKNEQPSNDFACFLMPARVEN